VRRIGGNLMRAVDVRVIAATSLTPESAIRDAGLRRDLYYRLSLIHIHLGPLRERLHELPLLAASFIEQFAPERRVTIPEAEIHKLEEYDWPGNIRELRNVIERSLILQEGEEIFPSQILASPLSLPDRANRGEEDKADYAARRGVPTLDEVERGHILATLERFSRNYSRTADALGISLSTLKRKLKEYGQR
jgi:transcriptional regulator with PAS, ATPase and Fis domain